MFRVRVAKRSGTCRVKRNKQRGRVVVSADGAGVVSHAGVGLLREMAQGTGLIDGITQALIGTYRGVPVHAPGRVFADLAAAVADGADAITGILPGGEHLRLCRLRYGGSASRWGFAIYRASHNDYQPSALPNGATAGTPEDALDTACGLYLGDPTAWLTPPKN